MSAKSKKPSPAIQLLEIAWENINAATGHSWERVNHGMRIALDLAINYGFRFDEGDWKTVESSFRPGYWISKDQAWCWAVRGANGKHGSSEDLVMPHNMSAVKSLEAAGYPCWMLRGFRLYDGCKLLWMEDATVAAILKADQHPSSYFQKHGLRVKVTNINSERVVLSHYGNRDSRKPSRLIKVTRELLASQNALFAPPKKPRKGKEVA